MRSLKLTCLTLCLAGILSSLGCCYHAQHFGKKRDIGLGEIGCATCGPCDSDECCPVACPTDCGPRPTDCGPRPVAPEQVPGRLPEKKLQSR
jgi:hypothetical protein